ncbi:MAG: sucD [Candidatus Saccharibacteria bacterium]|nr:sucD [Candidatus Saccharibacteria bacterium]
MNSSLLSTASLIVQGITGSHGAFHTAAMRAAGTSIVAGTSPNKAGTTVDGVPVYSSIADIKKDHQVDVSVIFVPAPYAKGALLEAIHEHIPLVVCITEGIPVHDMLDIHEKARQNGVTLIGPNCPGVLIPGVGKLGIIPYQMGLPGTVGVVSRSGTLTYEAVAGLSARNIGQKYVIGIGGDRIRGTSFTDCLKLFEADPAVDTIVLIGEIGGTDEQLAARYIQENVTKPVFAYVAGHHAPAGVQLGHAGAILGSSDESANAKSDALRAAGANVSISVPALMASVEKYYATRE